MTGELDFPEGLPLRVAPIGIPTSTTWVQVALICLLLDDYEVKLFVEIGMYKGGLSAIMSARSLFDEGFNYTGIEIGLSYHKKLPYFMTKMPSAHIVNGDCFDVSIRTHIEGLIESTDGRALVFCDGGDKPRELFEYGRIIRDDDLILVHDYPGEAKEEKVQIAMNKWNLKKLTPPYWPLETSGMILLGRNPLPEVKSYILEPERSARIKRIEDSQGG